MLSSNGFICNSILDVEAVYDISTLATSKEPFTVVPSTVGRGILLPNLYSLSLISTISTTTVEVSSGRISLILIFSRGRLYGLTTNFHLLPWAA